MLIRVVEAIICLHIQEIKIMSIISPKDRWASTHEIRGVMDPKDKWELLGLTGTMTLHPQQQEPMGKQGSEPLIKVGLHKMDLDLVGLLFMEQGQDMGKDIDQMDKIKGLHRYQMSKATQFQQSIQAILPQDMLG